MISSLLAHENLSCQTVKRKPAFTNIFQNCLTAILLLQERGKKIEQLRKLNHCQCIDCHLAREEREQMKKKVTNLYCFIENQSDTNKCNLNTREVNTNEQSVGDPEGPKGQPK